MSSSQTVLSGLNCRSITVPKIHMVKVNLFKHLQQNRKKTKLFFVHIST